LGRAPRDLLRDHAPAAHLVRDAERLAPFWMAALALGALAIGGRSMEHSYKFRGVGLLWTQKTHHPRE
jgi:hypothetical protein